MLGSSESPTRKNRLTLSLDPAMLNSQGGGGIFMTQTDSNSANKT